jgi:predicted membrane-bound mannosyltransferase
MRVLLIVAFLTIGVVFGFFEVVAGLNIMINAFTTPPNAVQQRALKAAHEEQNYWAAQPNQWEVPNYRRTMGPIPP